MVENRTLIAEKLENKQRTSHRKEAVIQTATRGEGQFPHGKNLMATLWERGTYVSGDEMERDEARRLGYRNVLQHLNEIQSLEPLDVLVIDLDHVLYENKETALTAALEAASRGVLVGIHYYGAETESLNQLRRFSNVRVARNHRSLLRHVGH